MSRILASISTCVLITVILSGCASQELAQRHWAWLRSNPGGQQTGAYGSGSGVSITPVTIQSSSGTQSFQVITPAK